MADDLEILVSASLDLAKSLTDIQENIKTLQAQVQSNTLKLTAELDQAASKAKIDSDIKSIKSNFKITGQVDTSATQQQIKAGLDRLKEQKVKIQGVIDRVATDKNFQEQMRQLPNMEATASVKTEGVEQLENLREQIDSTGTSATDMASKLYLARTALQILKQTATEAVETVKELDAAATNLAIVTGGQSGETYQMLEQYNSMARELGATTIQISDAAASWLRQGKDTAETAQLIEQSIMLSKVAMIDSETSTKNLTSAMRGYKLAVSDASGVVDKLAALDSKAAVTASDLAVAMSQTASSANIGGVSMDRLLGYLATVQEVTQRSAETIGQSFKTIFARMGNIKLGQFFDDEGNDLSDVESSLAHYGIALRNAEGDFRDFGTVLDDLYAKWDQFRAVDQRAIAQAFAGTRQQENFLVLMENYGKALEYSGVAADSAGTALQKFSAYQESIEAKSAAFTAAMESLAMDTIDRDFIKDLIDAGTAVVEFTDKIGLLKATLVSLGVGGALKGLKVLSTKVKSTASDIFEAGEAITGVTGGMKTAVAGLGATIKSSMASNPIGWVMLGVSTITMVYQYLKQAAEEAHQAVIDEAAEANEKLSELNDSYQTNIDRLEEINALKGTSGWTAELEAEANSLERENEALRLQIQYYQDLADAKNRALYEQIKNDVNTTQYNDAGEKDGYIRPSHATENSAYAPTKTSWTAPEMVDSTIDKIEALIDEYSKLDVTSSSFVTDQAEYGTKFDDLVVRVADARTQLEEAIAQLPKDDSVAQGWQSQLDELDAIIDAYHNFKFDISGAFSDQVDGVLDDVYKYRDIAAEISDAQSRLREVEDRASGSAYLKAYWQPTIDQIKQEIAGLKDIQSVMEELDNYDGPSLSDVFNSYADFKDGKITIAEMNEQIESLRGLYDLLNQIDPETYNENWWERLMSQFEIPNVDSIASKIREALGYGGHDAHGMIAGKISEAFPTYGELQGFIDWWEEYGSTVEGTVDDVLAAYYEYRDAISEEIELPNIKGYEAIKSSVEAVSTAQRQLNSVLMDGDSLTEEAYQALVALAGGEEALAGSVDVANGYLITNAEYLNALVEAATAATQADLKLAESQQMLKHHELVQTLKAVCDGLEEYDDDTMAVVDSLLEQIDATEMQIAQFKLLEQQLLGTTSAFEKLANAKAIDDARDYTDDLAEGISGFIDAFEKHEFGTQYFKEAFDAFIPEDVYSQFTDVGDQIDAGWDYLNTKLARYFNYDNGNVSIDFGNVQNFVQDALQTTFGDSTVFTGTLENFDLNPQITSIKELADAMGVTTTTAFTMANAISKYTIGNEDFLSRLSMDGASLETQMYACNQNMADLLQKQTQLGKAGKVGTAEWDALQKDIKACSTEMSNLAKQAKENIQANIEVDSNIKEKQQEVDELEKQLNSLDENSATYEATLENYNQAKQELNDLIQEKYNLEEPTELTIEVALEQVQSEIDATKAKLDEIANFDGENYTVKATADADQEEVNALVENLHQLEAEQHEIKVYAGIDDEEAMNGLEEIEAFQFSNKTVTVSAYTQSAISALNNVASTLRNLDGKSATVTVTTIKKEVTESSGGKSGAYGTARAYGTAHERGYWGTRTAEKNALLGELGKEIVVDPRTGIWQTVGENGAVMMDLPKGAIIFNHRQTEQLLRNRRINSRGEAYAWGNAHAFNMSNKKFTFGTLSSGRTTSSNSSSVSVTSGGSASTSTSTDSDSETPWMDELKYYQHLRAMELITDQEYYDKLDELMSRYYSVRESYIDDYRSLMEEAYDLARELADDWFNDKEHDLFVMDKNGASAKKQIAVYREMQQEAHRLANEARAYGLDENSDYIQQLQKQWWEYEDAIRELRIDEYESALSELENAISLKQSSLDDAVAKRNYGNVRQYASEIVAYYRQMQEKLHEEAEYYRSLGYSDTSDEVSKLSLLWREYNDTIKQLAIEAWQQILDNTNDAVDEIQKVYDTLHKAADEFADFGGYLSMDTVQEIFKLDTKYLAYLRDENDQLVINDELIEKILAAKTEELALDNALAYVERIRAALNGESTESLNELLYATQAASSATWDLVYANLAQLGLSDDQYQAAVHNIDAIRNLAKAAIAGIGQTGKSASEELAEMKSGLDDILKYIMEMLKQRVHDEINGIKDMKDAYGEVIDQRKEALRLAKEENGIQKTLASKMKELAKLQAQYDALSLDDSRSAQAQRAEIAEKMADLQDEINELQADRMVDTTEKALDEMQKAYESEKDAEIKELEDSISSTEKLYRMAMDYLNNDIKGDYERLKNELLQWNYDVGNSFESEIVSAWESAMAAAQRYGDLVTAMQMVPEDIANRSNDSHHDTVSNSMEYDHPNVNGIVSHMKQNSRDWNTANSGSDADKQKRLDLEAENRDYADQISQILFGSKGKLKLGSDGVWYLPDGRELYKVYAGEYHSGGVVGGDGASTLKQDEVFAKLQKGEIVLPMKVIDKLIPQFENMDALGKAFTGISDYVGKSAMAEVLKINGTGTVNNVTNNSSNSRSGDIIFGDTIINGAASDAIPQHIKVTEDMMNQIAKWMGLKM